MKSFSSRQTSSPRSARLPGRRLCAPGAVARPRDRHTRASLGVVDLEARPGPAAADQHRGLSLPPPTGTAARALRPLRRSRALQLGPPVPPAPSTPVGPGVLMGGLARWLVVWQGPAAAHGRHGLALRS